MRHRSILRDEVAARLKELGNVSRCSFSFVLVSIVWNLWKELKPEIVKFNVRLGWCLQVSDSRDVLERTFLSPAALAAGRLLATWMRDAGLRTYAS